ncbi:Plasmodium exported protein, unknown function [Plasmodium malariae]|uniref:Fam-m protein n=1 Tax=Plasmodium malariae TaxID=5858 RepID=A0A1D3JI39_PLAMA|nr:Plasmodium exported protein, unknown function [Plasmodium malariae]XP_028859197.1 Plasmodium exported protein, unknown function [Plasmodium malariae]SBT85709.1 Plasmodium exported protein, unknown function [Plasmodium malariae]SBT85928.1 Plasmodium exported protein, unknown function [Plasmodium malariae]
MKKNCRSFFYVEIAIFIILTWIYHINSNVNLYNNSLDKNDNIYKTLYTRTCRFLEEYGQKKGSNIVWIKGDIPTIEEFEKLYPPNNAKVKKERYKHPNGCSLNNAVGEKQRRKNIFSVYKGADPYFQKRTFDKTYFKNKVRDFTNEDFKFLRNKIELKEALFYVISIFFVPIILILNVIIFLDCVFNVKNSVTTWTNSYCFSVGFVIFTFIVMAAIIYIYSKIVKYDKFALIKNKLNNTMFPLL